MTVTLRGIHVYPLKSARGISVAAWPVGPRGLRHDRHWMVIDEQHHFVTQRQLPKMSLIGTALEDDGVVLTAPGRPALKIVHHAGHERVTVHIWKDVVEAVRVGGGADAWMRDFLGIECSVVGFANDVVRQVDPTYAQPGDQVGFTDGFSFLLASEASLADLNARLPEASAPMGMHRFRPNLVVSGTEPFAEDEWRTIRVGEIEFDVVKPCARCSITTVDEQGAIGKEPLATLSRFRRRRTLSRFLRSGNEVLFAQNLVHRGTGMLRVGDPVVVLSA